MLVERIWTGNALRNYDNLIGHWNPQDEFVLIGPRSCLECAGPVDASVLMSWFDA